MPHCTLFFDMIIFLSFIQFSFRQNKNPNVCCFYNIVFIDTELVQHKTVLNLNNFLYFFVFNESKQLCSTLAQRPVFGINTKFVIFGSNLKEKLGGHH